MQNMFQIGFALADLLPGTGQTTGQNTGQGMGQPPAQVLRGIVDQAVSQANGQPLIAKGIDVTGPADAPEFAAVFETLPAPMTALSTLSPEDRLAPTGPSGSDPADQVPNGDALFDAILSGDIDIDEVIPPGTPLSDRVKAALAQRVSNPTGATDPGVIPDPLSAENVSAALQTLAASAQPGSAVQAAALRLQSHADDLQSAVTTSTAQFGGLPPRTPALTPLAGTPLSGLTPANIVNAASGEQPLAAPALDPQSTAQLTTAGDRSRAALPEGMTPAQPVATGADTQQPALSALARDLEQGRKAEARSLAEERAIISETVARDAPLPRPGIAPPAAAILPAQLPTASDALPLNPAVPDGDPLVHDADIPARDARGLTTLGATTQQALPTPMSPAQAQQITRQIAIAIQNSANRTVELTLNPVELGRVRISLSSAEAGMVVSIQADRPETLDLMRRNAELLSLDFSDIGYDGATFSFEGSDQRDPTRAPFEDGSDTPDDPLPILSAADDAAQPSTTTQTLILGDGSVDIRL
ncbi:MAG: flagellar hook-length control protein FliK [Pseudomonadota bacterium]